MATETTRVVRVGGREVTVVRKNIKNMYLRVRPDGEVVVTAPRRMALRDVKAFVASHEQWIATTLERLRERAAGEGEDGGAIPGGEAFRAKWTPERKRRAEADLRARIPAMVERWAQVLGVRPAAVSYRAMTSRWGSTTLQTGTMRFNLELAERPDALVDSVVLHEMIHLYLYRQSGYRGHGIPFQRAMTACMPDWRDRKRALDRRP